MRARTPALYDAEWLREQYEVAQRSTVEIASELGVRPSSVSKALRRCGVAMRPGGTRPARDLVPPNPSGLCGCGCGERTRLAPVTNTAIGWKKGEPIRFIRGHHLRGRPALNRVEVRWAEEDRGYETPCWIWLLSLYPTTGYGQVMTPNGPRGAHRVLYEERVGPVPTGLQLDHLCRQRDCVRPDHLEPVTNAENAQRGNQAKLTPEGVREIRRLREDGMLLREIAARFGVTNQAISDIARRKVWANV